MSQFRNVLVFTLSVTSIVWGQSPGTKPVSDSAKAPLAPNAQGQVKTVDATRKKALDLLDQLLVLAGGFTDAEVRIRVQAQIADLLWEHDQPRARGLLIAAFSSTAEAELPPVDKDRPPSYVGADSHYPLRVDLLRIISQRDSALAVKLIATVVDQPPNVDPKFFGSGYGQYSEQGLLYHQIAHNIAGSDPAAAAQIARAFIEKGNIDSGVQVLRSLPAANVDLTRDIFAQALAAARRDKERTVSNMRSLADVIFPRFGEGVILFTSGDRDPRTDKPRSPEFIEPFLEFAYDAITEQIKLTQGSERRLNGPQSPPDFTVARLLLPYFERYMQDKATILRPLLEEAVRVAAASARERGEIGRTAGFLTEQEMVEAAETATRPEQREGTYFQAAIRAAQAGHVDQAKEIATKITGVQTRAAVEAIIRRTEDQNRSQASRDAIRRGDFDTAYRLINEHSDVRRRILELGILAVYLQNHKEAARAAEVLSEAQQLTPNSESSIERMTDRLEIANIATRLDVNRGFEAMRSAVIAMNNAKVASRWTTMETTPGGTGETNIGLEVLGFHLQTGFG